MEYALSELFTLQMGKTPSRDNSSYWKKSENNWISIADLTNSGKYISNTKAFGFSCCRKWHQKDSRQYGHNEL